MKVPEFANLTYLLFFEPSESFFLFHPSSQFRDVYLANWINILILRVGPYLNPTHDPVSKNHENQIFEFSNLEYRNLKVIQVFQINFLTIPLNFYSSSSLQLPFLWKDADGLFLCFVGVKQILWRSIDLYFLGETSVWVGMKLYPAHFEKRSMIDYFLGVGSFFLCLNWKLSIALKSQRFSFVLSCCDKIVVEQNLI